ncbi:unnamed protein product [Leptidea sinapis]|uniref:IQ motif and ubiquitin-like domain-containing protein n=1 Tax=Leptidea sinapis TaxID=189913 RepID=A0A5E4R691_9NEOP|nr:unnamed protein product [Leptidea sinapis]
MIGIIQKSDCVKGVVSCQCELGREKLITAPPFKRFTTSREDPSSRYKTAPCARDAEKFKCPTSHVLTTFKSPLHPNEVYQKVFPANTPVQYVKRKLAKLLSVSNSNLLLAKNRDVLKDTSLLSDLNPDPQGNLALDVYTKDAEEFSLKAIPNESFVHELLQSIIPKKKTMAFIAIKFNIRNQSAIFTRSYHSIMKIHEVKKNLGGLFQVDPNNIILLREDHPLKDRMALLDLDYDNYGNVEVELLMKDNVKLNLDKLYKEIPLNDIISVCVPFGSRHKHINVEIFSKPMKKPFLGGFRNVHTGAVYHHAYTQTPQKPEKLLPENKTCRDTQTAEMREKIHVDRWKHAEIARISQLHSKGPKIAEFTLLLDKEVELLRCIEDYRIKVKEDVRKIKEKKFLEELSKPVAWYGRDGKLITMDTIEIQRARKLKELYCSFLRDDMETNERMELLVDMKYALQEFRHPLAEDIISLLDRECDLLIRRCNDHQLAFLRRRISTSIFQLLKTSELNSGVTKCKDIRDYREMQNHRLHFCEMCHQVKIYKDFPLNAKMTGFFVCTSCSWKDVNERSWVDMTPYKFILRAVQRDERRRKCWGSLAFVLQEKDIYFIVEKLWHAHSAISECSDLFELRLCRWRVEEDWSPWNCFLVTLQEMKAHIKLEHPEDVYDEELVQKVLTIHKLAKADFEQLLVVNKHFTESGDWTNVKAPAVARVSAVDRI